MAAAAATDTKEAEIKARAKSREQRLEYLKTIVLPRQSGIIDLASAKCDEANAEKDREKFDENKQLYEQEYDTITMFLQELNALADLYDPTVEAALLWGAKGVPQWTGDEENNADAADT